MKYNLVLLFLILTYACLAQSKKQISYFKSTTDYLNGKVSKEIVVPKKIKFKSEKFLHITKLLTPNLGKKSKKAGFPWAIFTDSTVYFNFRYAIGIQSPELYVKPDVLGRFCVVYADKETLRTIHSFSPNYYGGGLSGVLIKESEKWKKSWTNENGEKINIFIVDTKKLELKHFKGFKNAAWKILDRKNINEILGLNLTKDELKEISLDKIKTIIIDKNNVG